MSNARELVGNALQVGAAAHRDKKPLFYHRWSVLKHRVVLTLGGGAEVRRQGSGERRGARPGPEGRDLPRLGERRGGAAGGVRGGHVGGERAGADRHRNL